MKCPNCERDTKTRVKETRLVDGDIVRRRECGGCNHVFGTKERVDGESTVGIGRGNNPNSTRARPWDVLTDAWGNRRG